MVLRDILARLPAPLRSLKIEPPKQEDARYNQDHRLLSRLATLSEPSAIETRFPERFVHDIWQSQLYDPRRLRTTDGQTVVVLDPGTHNKDSGPDFLNARVRIGEMDWRGDIEIHFRSSDWVQHRHQFDQHYNSVVLHVTFDADFWTTRLSRPDGSALPEVVLKNALAVSASQTAP